MISKHLKNYLSNKNTHQNQMCFMSNQTKLVGVKVWPRHRDHQGMIGGGTGKDGRGEQQKACVNQIRLA